ncbi:hypothetical protein [Lentzea flaviverrucosa]|uniref:Uncharacterized protein n=1 Tax=Lentzea flaviverrucosa TaxID=200379 RepID=A0A1H9XXB1_9PSEU|nr:hypothetical protein [Lentzea flaviverrucosa]RDI17103.1 hypothetical protein DFR72_12266 [Lentzea flaviverrucosa]SES50825.1 hypothetical protein SAMN05216195_12263 [Lentzea flaviverrucosa]
MRAGVFLRWVAHPLTVGATAVLLLNDHVFKQAWPGLVTGKLSDVAGLVVAPAVLALLSGLFRAGHIGAAAATLLTGAGFAWVKLTRTGAEVASAAWSVVNGPSVVLADPSDLIALPALGLAWWAWRRSAAAPPLPDRPAHRLRVVLAMPFAVLAIAATSPPSTRIPSVDSVQVVGGQVVIEVDERLYGSGSGVGDWTLLPETPTGQVPERQQVEACVPDDTAHCYRVHGGDLDLGSVEATPRGGRLLGVDETTDGGRTWHTAWEVPAARWLFVKRQHPFPGGIERVSKLASVDVQVRAVPGGHEVIVANGVEGLAVRGADGAWRRVPVVVAAAGLELRPAPLTGFGQVIGPDVKEAGTIILLALLIGMSVAVCRTRARLGHVLAAVLPLVFLLAAEVPISGAMAFANSSSGTSTVPALVFVLCLIGIGIGLTMAQGAVRRSRVAVVDAAAVLTGLAFLGPALGWTLGFPAERGTVDHLGLILAAGCMVLVVAAGWWAGRDPAITHDSATDAPRPPVPGSAG